MHVGYLHFNNTANDRVNIWHASAAAERKLTDDLKIVIDTGVYTNADPESNKELVFLVTGLIYSPHPNIDLDLGYKIERSDSLRANVLLSGIALRWKT